MPNYINILGVCYPDAQGYITGAGDPTVYEDIIWLTNPPIPKALLDACEIHVDELLTADPVNVIGAPGEGDSIQWDSATETWISVPINKVDLATVQSVISGNIQLTNNWTTIPFAVNQISNATDVIEQTSNTVFKVKEDGLYSLRYNFSVETDRQTHITNAQILKNGTDLVVGSTGLLNSYPKEIIQLTNETNVELQANDELTVHMKYTYGYGSQPDDLILPPSMFTITKLDGVKGAKGDPGDAVGSSIHVLKNSVAIPNGPFDTLNFTGSNITTTSLIPGTLTIAVTPTATSVPVCFRHNGDNTQTFNSSWTTIQFEEQGKMDSGYTYINGLCFVNTTGWYEVEYNISLDVTSNSRTSSQARLLLNNTPVDGSNSFGYHRTNSNGESTFSARVMINMTAGSYVKVEATRIDGGGSLQTLPHGCRLIIKKI